jgi:uncharacterized membrane protein HdeD (DUF308 family)
MFTGSPIFIRVRSFGQQATQGAWWLLMMPGLLLTLLALAILVWPELLAYMVATALLFGGVSLLLWGWSVRRAEQRAKKASPVYYEVL